MTSIAALTAAALLAGLSAPPLAGLPEASGDVTWRAVQAVWHGESGTYELSGDVLVQRGGVVLRAQRATVDPATSEVWARGDVLLADTHRAVAAEAIHAVLDGPFEASDVTAFYKAQPLEPVRVRSRADGRAGRNLLTFRADRVEGDAGGTLRLSGMHFTPCDCGAGRAPSWELAASRAEVKGDRLNLHWPVLRIAPFGAVEPGQRRHVGYVDGLFDHPVPVLAAPWISLPLTDRQTGLLAPELGRSSISGFHVGLPVFVTLGRSADLTATPEYFFGPKDHLQHGGAVEGPGGKVELRWAPAERAFGQILFHLVDDHDHERLSTGQRGGRDLRFSAEGQHAQDLGPRTRLRADLSLSADPFVFRDFRGIGLPGDAFYSRSDVLVSHRAEAWVVEGGAAYHEPLVYGDLNPLGGTGPYPRAGPEGLFGVRTPTLQRWPSAGATLLPSRLGPVQVDGRLGVSRYAPLEGHRGEILPSDPGAVRTDAVLDSTRVHALPREATTRGDARLQLAAPLLLGRTVSFEPFVRGAALGYAFDAAREPAATAWGVGGAAASIELQRRYGTLEHRIVPRLELVAGTDTWRQNPGDPFPAYDAWDRIEGQRVAFVPGTDPEKVGKRAVVQKLSAAPDDPYAQLRASLLNRLDAGPAGRLTFEVGQDADLRRGKMAESFASAAVAKGPVTADASVRLLAFGGRPALAQNWLGSWLDKFTRLHGGVAVHDGRGDVLRASIDSTGSGAVGAEGSGVDALFDLASSGAAPDAWYRAGATVTLGAAKLDYDVRLAARRLPAGYYRCTRGDALGQVPAGRVVEQDGVLVWDSPCHCFVLRLNATRDICGDLTYGLSLDLSKAFQGAARK